jgi:hypothetical protein
MDFPWRISSFSSSKRFLFPVYASVLVTVYSVYIYKWYFYIMITISDKNEDFRIYLINVYIQTRNKKVKKCEGVHKILNFHERGSWDEKVWEPLQWGYHFTLGTTLDGSPLLIIFTAGVIGGHSSSFTVTYVDTAWWRATALPQRRKVFPKYNVHTTGRMLWSRFMATEVIRSLSCWFLSVGSYEDVGICNWSELCRLFVTVRNVCQQVRNTPGIAIGKLLGAWATVTGGSYDRGGSLDHALLKIFTSGFSSGKQLSLAVESIFKYVFNYL